MNYDKIMYYSLKSHKTLNTEFKDKKVISNSLPSHQITGEYSAILWKIFQLIASFLAPKSKKRERKTFYPQPLEQQ